MTAKEYLQKIRSERLEIIQLQETIDELAYSLLPSGIRYDTIKVQTSPDDAMSRVMAQIDEYERKIREHLARLVDRQNVASAYVIALEKSEHRLVLTLYYLTGERPTWHQVADKMALSEQRIYQLHNEAIAELEKIWSDEKSIVN